MVITWICGVFVFLFPFPGFAQGDFFWGGAFLKGLLGLFVPGFFSKSTLSLWNLDLSSIWREMNSESTLIHDRLLTSPYKSYVQFLLIVLKEEKWYIEPFLQQNRFI